MLVYLEYYRELPKQILVERPDVVMGNVNYKLRHQTSKQIRAYFP